MRTKPATRFNHESEHAQYGIVNWFRKKCIYDNDVIKECVYVFCEQNGFDMKEIKNERKSMNWVQNRFNNFSKFSSKYLIENNYA